jgi:CHRD domain
MHNLNWKRRAIVAVASVLWVASLAQADDDRNSFKAHLMGFNEPPPVSSSGNGKFQARISDDESSLEYELDFRDLEGIVTQAHIHVGQKGVNGGITIWLCGTPTNPGPAGTPSCGGPSSGGARRAVTAADVVGPAGQGIAPGEFSRVFKAIRAGVTYVNVHSTRNPGGEIRGQIKGLEKGD